MRTKICTTALLLSLVTAAVAFGPAPDADAEGTYLAYTCRAQDFTVQAPAPATDWGVAFPPKSTADTFSANCASGPLRMEMSPFGTHPLDDFMHMTFAPPADTQIQDYVIWRSVQLASTYNYRYYEQYADGTTAELDKCFPSAGCTSKGNEAAPADAANKVCGGTICPRGHTNISGLMVSLTCGVSSGACAAATPGARFQLHRADIRLVDRLDPIISAPPTGAIAESRAPVSGVQTISVSGSDRGGGVFEALVTVDGKVQRTVLDANGGLCRKPFMAALPCKLSANGAVQVDTSRLADGQHSLKVAVTDVAGNVSAAWGPVTFTSANASCNPEPRVGGLTLRAGIAARKGKVRRTVTTRVGRKLELRGQLVGAQGEPIGGAPICLATREDVAHAATRLAGTATTDAGGNFAVRLPAGPSRTVFVVHRVASGAITTTVRVRVRAAVRFRAAHSTLRNGETVHLVGRLGARPRKGVLVELQARRGSGWQTFGTTKTLRRGRFDYPYQFTRTTGVQHYHLRARVSKQPGYPFVAGASRPATVTVRG